MDISNVNETHNHHSPPRPPSSTSSAQTRQKIVEILAGTANGCLSELGFVPGMPQRLKELERQNEEWKLENMKLYQDNASLLDLIHQQNERIKEIRASDPEKNIRIMELNTELQKTRSQRDEFARAYSANNSSPSQLQHNYTHLQGDYIRVITGYRTKCDEVRRLQDHIQTLVEQHSSRSHSQGPQTQTQQYPQHQPQQQFQQQNRPPVQQHPQHPQHHLQQQFQQQSRPQVQQHPQHQLQQQFQQQNRPQIPQHLQSQPLHQLQPDHVQRSQSNQNHPAQRQSASTLLQPHSQKHVQQQHPQPVPGPQPGQQRNTQSPPVYGQIPMQKYPLSQTQQAIFEQRYQANLQNRQPRSQQSSGSMPGTSTRPGQESFVNIANLQQHPPPPLLGQPSSRPNSKPPHSNGLRAAQSTSPMVPTMPEPLATRSRTSLSNNGGPPTPVVSPLNQLFFAPPLDFNSDLIKAAIPFSNKVSSASIEPNTSISAISPQDTYFKVNQAPSPQVKDVRSFNINTSSAGTSISPSVASQPVNVALGLSASIHPQQINSLKRDSPAGSEDHYDLPEQLQKRPRLEGPQLQSPTNTPIEPVVDGTENTVQMHVDEDEDEVVEVGPDGLRLVNHCISDLFGEEGEKGEGRYCKLCIARRTMGYRADSPKPFVNATNDELQEHCMTEHAEAWDTLRQTV